VGFDLIGIGAMNEKGEYFRNNIWWWPRLWELCCSVTPELTDEDLRVGHHNDGLEVSGVKHVSLVRNLEKAVCNRIEYEECAGGTKSICGDREKVMVKIMEHIRGIVSEQEDVNKVCPSKFEYQFDWDNVQEFLDFIKNNEGFRIC
jgi:hypothetical protein